MPGKQPQIMHLSTKSPTQTIKVSAKQQQPASNINQQTAEPIKLTTGKLPKKTSDVKQPVRRRAQPIGEEDGIPTTYVGGTKSPTSGGERRIVMPSREASGNPEEPPVKNLVEGVLGELDDVIDQKYKEYQDFCNALIEEDEMNRAMLSEEQIEAIEGGASNPDEDPPGTPPPISEEEAFKVPELDPVEKEFGIGQTKQRDYNSYRKSKSIFDTQSKSEESKPIVKKEDIPQVIPELPKVEPKAELPFLVNKQEDGTLVADTKSIEEMAENNEQIPEDGTEHYENPPLTTEEIEDINEMIDKNVGDLVDNLIEKVPEIESAVKDIPAKSMADFFANNENFQEIQDNSFQEENIKEEVGNSSDYTTVDELLEDFEISEEDKKRMEDVSRTMQLSPEDRAKLVVQQRMKEQEEAFAAMEATNAEKVEETENKVIAAPTKLTTPEISNDIFADIDDEDFKELDEDEEDTTTNDDALEDESMKELRKEITDKIKVVSDKFDISTYSVAAKPVSYQAILKKEDANERVTDWVLMASNRHIAFTAFSGTQLEKINPQGAGRNALNAVRTQWQEIYEHVVDPYKPATLEQWAKTVRFSDMENIYMGIYVANFLDSNFIPYNCNHCHTMFLSDNMNILDMIKYKDDAAKEKFRRLYDAEPSPSSGEFPTEIVPISDTVAVQIKNPSIYDVLFETASLDQKFRDKYEQVLALMVYIEGMYKIDKDAHMIVPIAVKQYPNNMAKSIKSKVITFSKVLNSLGADSYSILQACIRNMIGDEEEITFEIPEVTCKKCGTVIPKERRSAIEILFTRHQLAALATM